MAKEFTLKMSKTVLEMSEKPLRSKEEAILLLLYTIRMFDIEKYLNDDREEKVIIAINKMNRIFYQLNDKIFSMQFPFLIAGETNEIRIYSSITGNIIDAQVLSFLIETFEKIKDEDSTFDIIFEIIMENEYGEQSFSVEQKWQLISYLLKYDIGYLRYDYDPKNEKGKIHPLNHFDIFLDSSAAFKVGLNKRILCNEFINVLDITTECAYIGELC